MALRLSRAFGPEDRQRLPSEIEIAALGVCEAEVVEKAAESDELLVGGTMRVRIRGRPIGSVDPSREQDAAAWSEHAREFGKSFADTVPVLDRVKCERHSESFVSIGEKLSRSNGDIDET